MAHAQQIREPVTTGVSPAVLAARTIYFVSGVVIAFIVVRMVLLLLGANQANAFVDFVYAVSGILVMPFFGIFAYTPSYGVSTFEISSLVAVIVYTLITWGLVSLVTLGSRYRTEI